MDDVRRDYAVVAMTMILEVIDEPGVERHQLAEIIRRIVFETMKACEDGCWEAID